MVFFLWIAWVIAAISPMKVFPEEVGATTKRF
jgi:hypothetical protein